MNSFFYWFFAVSCIVFFLRHISLKYWKEIESGEKRIREWTKIIGFFLVYFVGFKTTETYEFLLKFLLLDQRFGIPETKMAQALILVIFLTVTLSILVTILSFFESVIKDEFSGENFFDSVVNTVGIIMFVFVGHLFFIPLVYTIYIFFAFFFAGVNSGELTKGEINMIFSWLAISFFASIFYNLIVDGYRKNRFGDEETRKRYKEEKAKLKKEIGDTKRYLETVKGLDSVVFQTGSSELDLLKEKLKMLIRSPKDFLKEED